MCTFPSLSSGVQPRATAARGTATDIPYPSPLSPPPTTMAVHGKGSSNSAGAGVGTAVLMLLLCCTLQQAASENKTSRLRYGYYAKTCPEAESIIQKKVNEGLLLDRTVAPGLLRIFFHDCFIRGCDASILLDKTASGKPVEKEDGANGLTLNQHSLQLVDKIKEELEKKCPGIVSCADILAFATRDVVSMSGITHFEVPAGRKDGNASRAEEVILPTPDSAAEQLTDRFAQKGFSRGEMVVLSGAHSFGSVHCFFLFQRLYNFTNGTATDPSMNPDYADLVKFQCPFPNENSTQEEVIGMKANFDGFARGVLSNDYYKMLQKGQGLLFSDRALLEDPKTRAIVERMADGTGRWATKFAKVMVKLGELDVLVDNEGTVRKNCRVPN